MRAFQRLRMATPTGPNPRTTPIALLPPIPLYRRLLRAHRKLPQDMRLLGDEYVKTEWRSHQKIDNPIHIVGFLTEWQMYTQHLEGDSWREAKMDKTKLDKMSDDQITQLYELMQAIRNRDLEDNDPEHESNKEK
ncbi:ACN9-domain-containing protein [Patellaria atrata CBS 101060]|uniref:Succinate dehydrogenase assembly factor 3 n=1 Tax=Patellaria atrata CBS 101060 TaxID=1346257 RepID=A0A9P4S9S3_9PEZI|nr:ACN9-domain-containing protein [Patellaria atrata CBS 101060]